MGCGIVRTHTPGQKPTNGRTFTIVEVPSKQQKGPSLTSRSLAQRSYTWKMSTPECLVLKNSESYIQEIQETVGSRDSMLKGYAQKLIGSEFQCKGCSLKGD